MTFLCARRNDRRFRQRMAAVALGTLSLAGTVISSGTRAAAGIPRSARPEAAQAEAVSATPVQAQSAMVASAAQVQGQSAATTGASSPVWEYDVASIKVANREGADRYRVGVVPSSDGLTASNVTLQILIVMAYGVQNNQVIGAGDFLSSEHYDIDAKMSEATADALKKMTAEERTAARQKMMQALLAERFKLAIHRETKELPVYSLVVAKNGSKLKETQAAGADPSASAGGAGAGRGASGGAGISVSGGRGGTMSVTGKSMPISALVHSISTSLDRPVIDKTGLTGYYDFSLEWVREDAAQSAAASGAAGGGQPPLAPPEGEGQSIYSAIQEQLGLKLEAGKGPVEVIVVDKSEKPTGN
ncbi:MAG TPA: TIGR03435 family protein [Candidatus Acidoferrales bacterium]|nr:TIGR03435 family protein [Candidatus Acidoferrales bacterium]